MTLPRTGQRKVGRAPVASLALITEASAAGASSTLVVCASRALSVVTAATLVAGGSDAGTVCATTGCATGTAAADNFAGTLSFMPIRSFALVSRPFALASSTAEIWLRRAMLTSVAPGLTTWTEEDAGATDATGLLTGAETGGTAAIALG